MKPFVLTALLGAAALSAALAPSSVSAADAWIGRTEAPLRAGPGANYARTGALSACAQVEVTAINGGWVQITHAGRTAWTPARLLRATACTQARARPTRRPPQPSAGKNQWDGPMPYLRSY